MAEDNTKKEENIAVALMEVMTKEGVDGPRYFYSRIGTCVIKEITPEIDAIADEESVETTFYYDEQVSKQAGHHVYTRKRGGGKHITLTPIK